MGATRPSGARRAGGGTHTAAVLEAYDQMLDPLGVRRRHFETRGGHRVHVVEAGEGPPAVGIVRAARAAGLPVAISFTLEQDGRLPDGTPLSTAVTEVDAEGGAGYFMVNCAHPTHIAPGLADPGDWRSRIVGLRVNASTRSHEELDTATELDEGDPAELTGAQDTLRSQLPNLALVGGCCGTDARHVAAMWGVPPP